ncbi:MAG: hypothetical protein UR66_C0001G0085 [Candidatus Moranbacteria bacterium GW2011_GWE1_35_17]|nr:MAG: hypothetical protein UR66_C0001G0085 [Candidatus Moranbacteria bacterium GW2011_GWE1_35_17]KKP72750.1 MAG: hypothetical protein UR65_C0012G0015 [Candidatus Moranbacteria bacterium GW2011_GWE2_35_164]KKP81148.1 MAG: hypothetical protein UR82_C0071G0008 [Candidatus Moranbacteria bacterium GW2011_GWF1_35_5]KKP85196.1 MAG: hypothetical protein UR83_C0003G0031 [Candidatus Moranbacteria bacterium GW2011_GWF2_35_54]
MIANEKKIIFLDGDGTLWYPKKTKYTEKPHWIYAHEDSKDNYCEHLMMIPTALVTLKKLKKLGVTVILLSTHPHPPKEADVVINHKVAHFKLVKLFDEIHATREIQSSKGEFILKILKKRKIPKSRALMVGDSYRWDYKPAKDVGVDALIIESEYLKKDRYGKMVKNTIKKSSDVLEYI